MGFHFEPGTTIDGIPIGKILQTMTDVRLFRPITDNKVAETCLARGLIRRDPVDDAAFLLTDLGSRLRAGKVGERIPLLEANQRFETFMEDICLTLEERGHEDGHIQTAWLFGSLMRGDPTIGDVDMIIELPFRKKPDPFFSTEDDTFDLRHMPIPCQQISITCEQGKVSWDFVGEPGLHPDNMGFDDPPGLASIDTDQGRYRTGTPDEETVLETLAAVRELLENGEAVPLSLAATLRRDVVARYTGGANSPEPAAALIDIAGLWEDFGEIDDELRDAILAIAPEEACAPGF